MVVKVYISGISGNKEVKKRQQRVLMILDSKNIKYEIIDITEPGRESDKDFMQNNAKSNGGTVSDPNPRSPLPPQVFNDEEYCGDYDQFDLANEVDTLEQFLKVEVPSEEPQATVANGDITTEEPKDEVTQHDTNGAEGGQQNDEANESSQDKEDSHLGDATPSEGTELAKESSVEKESADRLKPDEEEEIQTEASAPLEETNLESKKSSKENTPLKDEIVNENGAVSSREQSKEKEIAEIESVKENPSEALIESEQAAAAE
ncbi:SH3 domain-binding glutamic acid-rich protein homolog [Zerene cesonia]|uniref:SH3 domain-binding glutamic acid-rich protein homolog n=1 Tax=Zerene cesonia TaxID=33412 RepID=UPI0018E4F3E9|nr:SH3 domain-binding glutamic acid-rich protein homolog [Zerene cesonia]